MAVSFAAGRKASRAPVKSFRLSRSSRANNVARLAPSSARVCSAMDRVSVSKATSPASGGLGGTKAKVPSVSAQMESPRRPPSVGGRRRPPTSCGPKRAYVGAVPSGRSAVTIHGKRLSQRASRREELVNRKPQSGLPAGPTLLNSSSVIATTFSVFPSAHCRLTVRMNNSLRSTSVSTRSLRT